MEIKGKTLRNIFLGIAACIVLYWLLHETDRFVGMWLSVQSVISPFLLGAGIAFIMNVPVRAFERMLGKLPNSGGRRVLAVVLTFLAVLLVLALVFWLLIPQVIATARSVGEKIPGFATNVYNAAMAFLEDNPQLMQWVIENTDFESMDIAGIVQKVLSAVGDGASKILDGAVSALGNFASALVNFVIALVFALYCLFRKETLAQQGRKLIYAFLPENWCDEIVRVLRLANSTFSNFLSGQCLEVLILGCLFAVAMAIFRMPYIPLVSVLVAVTAFIPVVGAFAGCLLGAFFILVDNPMQAVWFVVMFLVLQQIENNMIYPRVVGTSIGLPGMWVLVAVAVGGELMGVAGMFLMIPMASVLYALLREITYARLETRNIDPDKLRDHPPELRSKFREKRERAKRKRAMNLSVKEAAEKLKEKIEKIKPVEEPVATVSEDASEEQVQADEALEMSVDEPQKPEDTMQE